MNENESRSVTAVSCMHVCSTPSLKLQQMLIWEQFIEIKHGLVNLRLCCQLPVDFVNLLGPTGYIQLMSIPKSVHSNA